MKSYQIKITLYSQRVYRKLIIPKEISFTQLKNVIVESMNLKKGSYFEFSFYDPKYLITDDKEAYDEYKKYNNIKLKNFKETILSPDLATIVRKTSVKIDFYFKNNNKFEFYYSSDKSYDFIIDIEKELKEETKIAKVTYGMGLNYNKKEINEKLQEMILKR